MRIRPVVAELYHADRRTDGRANKVKLILALWNFSKASKTHVSKFLLGGRLITTDCAKSGVKFVELKGLPWIGIRVSRIWSTNRHYCCVTFVSTDEDWTQQGASEKKGLKIGTNCILETAFVLSNYFAGFFRPVKKDNLLRAVRFIGNIFLLYFCVKAYGEQSKPSMCMDSYNK